jgi:hypothetical protein
VRGHREGLCLAPRSQAWLTDGHWYITYGPVPIAGRTPAYPTPTGTFHVLSKDATYHSTEFHNAPMPYSGFFYPGDAFHADNVHQKSHGCIHLTMTDARIFSPCSTSVTGCRFGPEGSNKLIHFGWVGNGRAVPARTWWRALAAESDLRPPVDSDVGADLRGRDPRPDGLLGTGRSAPSGACHRGHRWPT